MLPRGIRNRNPGNIELSNRFQWKGEIRPSRDERFCTFIDPQHGLRAMMRLIVNYQKLHGINTLRGVIDRWAPPGENDTGAYIKAVSDHSKIDPNRTWDFTNAGFLVPVTKAMVIHENGYPKDKSSYSKNWYEEDIYQQAFIWSSDKIMAPAIHNQPKKEIYSWKFLSRILPVLSPRLSWSRWALALASFLKK